MNILRTKDQRDEKGQKDTNSMFAAMVTRYVSYTSCFQTVRSHLNFENIAKKYVPVISLLVTLINSGVSKKTVFKGNFSF